MASINNAELSNPVMTSFRYLLPLFFLLFLSVFWDYILSSNHVDGIVDYQDKSLRVLVVTVDHRELHEDIDTAGHTSLTAVLNYNYALRHNYDYRYYHPIIDLNKVAKKYNMTVPSQTGGDITNRIRSLHPFLREFRDSAWSKIPVLWHVASAVKQYDVILYLDSDVGMTAVQSKRSIQEAIVHWDDSYKERI